LEVSLCSISLVVLSPLLGLVALAVWLSTQGPVFFRQERMGLGGRCFQIVKFRTMRFGSSGPQVTTTGDPRVTPVGRLLRKTKLDELPELWNVVRGDLSLVGPRPEVPRYVQLESDLWREVLQWRPGITDPVTLRLRNEEDLMAQAAGDREAFYLEVLQPYKLAGYVEYLRKRTWWSDVKVLWASAWAVLRPKSAPPPTVEEVRAVARRAWPPGA
jgi:lipopolysaccharide/colanic/teichoic acid biosynthesis glycosyltransferase